MVAFGKLNLAYEAFEAAVARALGDDIRSDKRAARELWTAIAGVDWHHPKTGHEVGLTFRAAGELVANVRGEGSYIDWFLCAGPGWVSERIARALEKEGWVYDDSGEACDEPGCRAKARYFTRSGGAMCLDHSPVSKSPKQKSKTVFFQ